MRRHRIREQEAWIVFAAVLALAAGCARQPAERAGQPAQRLTAGSTLTRSLAPGEVHTFEVPVDANHFVRIEVEQRGVDVVARLFGPEPEPRASSDRRVGYLGTEVVETVSRSDTVYRLQLTAWPRSAPPGEYEVRLLPPRAATPRQQSLAAGVQHLSRAEELIWSQHGQPPPEVLAAAAEQYNQALTRFQGAESGFWWAETLYRLARIDAASNSLEAAIDRFTLAAAKYREIGDRRMEGITLSEIGSALLVRGDIPAAARHYEQALEVAREVGDRVGEGIACTALGQIRRSQYEIHEALGYYARALELFDVERDGWYRAHPLHNLGVLYLVLGKLDRARDYLDEARALWEEQRDRERVASSWNQMGELSLRLGRLDEAREHFERALDERRAVGDRNGEAATLANLARLARIEERFSDSLELFQASMEILAEVRDARAEARVLADLGRLHGALANDSEALRLLSAAVDRAREVGDRRTEAEALLGISQVERGRGRFSRALEESRRALAVLEAVRPHVVSEDLKTAFFATVQHHYEFHIDLLMQMHAADPEAGLNAEALSTSERARARSLLDSLAEGGASIRAAAAPELIAEERDLQRQLNLAERRRLRGAGDDADARREIRRLVEQLDSVRTRIRSESPHYASLTQPQPLPVEEIQQLLEPGTALLEYRMGPERSYLWSVTARELRSWELPARTAIEPLARRAHELLARSRHREARGPLRLALCQLVRKILPPAALADGVDRLVVVPDGALQYLPYAALPHRTAGACVDAPPLIAAYEVIHLPSASAIPILRREKAGRAMAEGFLAVLADPVFSHPDPRLAATPGRAVGGGGSYQRLPLSRREAEMILSLAPPKRSLGALDFDASKALVTGGGVADYRFVHFATHGFVDTEQPELSGIVLSQLDRAGRAIDGLLRVHEIYNLQLNAELVTLSACETALGKEIRGEGMVGLTRGFMYAGSSRVLASLWKVDDASTARLMERLYRAMLEEGLRPAAALRHAQNAFREEGEEPFAWAGFILQGEWL